MPNQRQIPEFPPTPSDSAYLGADMVIREHALRKGLALVVVVWLESGIL